MKILESEVKKIKPTDVKRWVQLLPSMALMRLSEILIIKDMNDRMFFLKKPDKGRYANINRLNFTELCSKDFVGASTLIESDILTKKLLENNPFVVYKINTTFR